MHELPPDMDDVLSLARSAQHEPNDATRERVRLAVVGIVAASAAETGLDATSSAAYKGARWSLIGKVALGVCVGTIATSWWFGGEPTQRTTRPAPAALAERPAAVEAFQSNGEDATTSKEPEMPRAETSSVGAESAAPPSLREELRWLQEADVALEAHAPARALTVLEKHRQRYPASSFADERDGLTWIARCQLDRAAATTGALRFLEHRGASVLRTRIESACRARP